MSEKIFEPLNDASSKVRPGLGSNVTRDLTLGGASGTQTLEVSGSAADGDPSVARRILGTCS